MKQAAHRLWVSLHQRWRAAQVEHTCVSGADGITFQVTDASSDGELKVYVPSVVQLCAGGVRIPSCEIFDGPDAKRIAVFIKQVNHVMGSGLHQEQKAEGTDAGNHLKTPNK